MYLIKVSSQSRAIPLADYQMGVTTGFPEVASATSPRRGATPPEPRIL
jgi:hypothetical protein